ncbi:MAG: hypothetical protein DWQ07_12205 [Chloroflexi bacterium]|nr:MAG: hypothetical protein DWQ07_12205 [Chloroflexota bacterium]
MNNTSPNISRLRQRIREETYKALGVTKSRFWRMMAHPLIALPTHRFAEVGANFDYQVSKSNFSKAARWVLPTFVSKIDIVGQENIPSEGPLLITSNHPGISDALVIAASIPRDDLKIIAGSLPFLKGMPNASEHFLYVDGDTLSKFAVIRKAIRHLWDGGSVLIFASGRLDPDPACLPGADAAIKDWSRSLEIMLRKAPKTKLLPTIVKGVLRNDFARNPFAQFGQTVRDRQRIAEFIQVMWQMLFPHSGLAKPEVLYGSPLQLDSLGSQERVIDTITRKARQLLKANPSSSRVEMPIFPAKN